MLGKLVAVWHGIVWYLREISGEARYDHYLGAFRGRASLAKHR